jgi:Holliday junction DNA helicase RuvB
MKPALEEFLYPAMEDYRVDVRIADGPHAQTIPMALERFTLIGATTRFGLLTPPMRARFGLVERLGFYPPADLQRIIARSATILQIPTDEAGASEIARRSRGTPRVANRLLRRVRDYAQVKADGIVTAEVAGRALDQEGVDEAGLDRLDRRFLTAIIENYKGGPVGLEAIAATINDEAETLAEVVEPFLLKIGYVVRSPTGRRATPAAYAHLGHALPASPGGQGQLPL